MGEPPGHDKRKRLRNPWSGSDREARTHPSEERGEYNPEEKRPGLEHSENRDGSSVHGGYRSAWPDTFERLTLSNKAGKSSDGATFSSCRPDPPIGHKVVTRLQTRAKFDWLMGSESETADGADEHRWGDGLRLRISVIRGSSSKGG